MRLSGEGENVLTTPETDRSSGSASRGGCSTAIASRSRMRSSSCGRQTAWVATTILPMIVPTCRWTLPSRGSADAPPISRPARIRSRPIKPGPVPHPAGGMQAPHVSLTIQARGMLNPTFTRVYFEDEAAANASDPVLQSAPASRRATLIAERVEADTSVPTYRFDIRYQGDDETVFFDV